MNATIENNNISNLQLHKMIFITNALNDGWCVKKKNEKYIFTKSHEDKKEFFLDNYLEDFICKNIKVKTINDV